MNAAFESPISAAQAAQQGKQWAELQSAGDRLCWLEFDPGQGHTRIRCRHASADSVLLTPAGYSVRSRVHEYGGGSYRLLHDGLVFVNEADQGLYWQSFQQPDSATLIYQREGFRYGDLQYDPRRNRIIAVEEQHAAAGVVHNRLVAISLNPLPAASDPDIRELLAEGADFYSSPRLNADASKLAWISWDHPRQPWNSTQLWLAELDEQGLPMQARALTSGRLGEQDEAVLQPEFGPDGALFFISDRNGWWNLYRYLEAEGGSSELLLQSEAEFCRAPWQLGQQAYVVLDQRHLGCSWWRDGRAELGVLHLPTRRLVSLGSWAAVHSLAVVKPSDQEPGQLLAIAEPGCRPGQLLSCTAVQALDAQCLDAQRLSSAKPGVIEQLSLPTDQAEARVVQPQHLSIPTTSGDPLYGLLYRPAATPGQQLPLIIQLHGGPTAQADARFDPLKQFWLQRGFALLDLNYRGSSGYGRPYRQQLQGRWGIADAEDVITAARVFIAQGWVDPARVVVRGSSAGGYTVLQLLSQQAGQRWLSAGASHYGISDLHALAAQTHKFESHYLDWLIGDVDRDRSSYSLRSPIHRPRDFCRPLIFFQGGLDRVVPAAQTYRLYNQLKGRGVAVEYLAFADERHGFRQAKNRARVLEREWRFYAEQLGLPDPIDPLSEAHYGQQQQQQQQ